MVALAGLAVLVMLLSMTVQADFDFWWHARLGANIFEQGSITPPDSNSFTFAGQPQANGEWLADALIYLAFASGGYLGANVLKGALVFGTCLCLFGFFSTVSKPSAATLLSALITLTLLVFALRFRLQLRPYLFSYLCFSGTLWLLGRYRRAPDPKTLLWICAVALLWSNLSRGAVFAPVLVGLMFVDRLFHRNLDWHLGLAVLGALLMSVLNPDGAGTFLGVADWIFGTEDKQELVLFVGEHQPLTTDLLWRTGLRYTWAAQVLGAVAAIQFVAMRGWRKPFHLLIFVVFMAPAFAMIRMVSFFVLAASVGCFLGLHRLLESFTQPLERHRSGALAATGVILTTLGGWAATSDIYQFGNGPKPNTFPTGALDYLDEAKLQGRMFNSYSIGGFAMWHSPHRPVFIDGRAITLYSPEFFAQYQRMLESPEAWEDGTREFDLTIALVEYDLRDGARHFPKHLTENQDWALVYWDSQSAVFIKRTPEHRAVIEQYQYLVSRPALNDLGYIDAVIGGNRHRLPSALVQIDKEISRSPENQEPRLAKVLLMVTYGGAPYFDAARTELEYCLGLEPDLAMEHSALGYLLIQQGSEDAARTHVLKALEIDPRDPNATALGTQLGLPLPEVPSTPIHPH